MIEVAFVNKMGNDMSVVNAARVSFAKVKKGKLDAKDDKLIKYLALWGHWSPFAHATMSFRIKAPIFVARQLVKHQVGLAWNEVSRRYIDDKPEFYMTDEWRSRPDKSIKQGSGDKIIKYDINHAVNIALETYNDMLEEGIAPEMARMILPQNTMTEWIWSGSVYAFSRVCNLRIKPNAQKETGRVAEQIVKHMQEHFPICTKYLIERPELV